MENINLRDYGRLIKDGELKMRSHEDGSRQKLRYAFIFNRGVIFCKTTRVSVSILSSIARSLVWRTIQNFSNNLYYYYLLLPSCLNL